MEFEMQAYRKTRTKRRRIFMFTFVFSLLGLAVIWILETVSYHNFISSGEHFVMYGPLHLDQLLL